MSETLKILGKNYTGVVGFKAKNTSQTTILYSQPTGTKSITITENGTTTEDVASYANAEITVNVSGGGGGGDNLPDFLANTIGAVNLPTLTSFAKAYAFRASSVTSVVLTGVTSFTAGAAVFQDSASLTVCVMPNIASAATNTSSTWNRCTSLTALDLGSWRFGGSEMASCSSLTTIILRPSQVLTLASANAFNGTPYASGGSGGTIYIPKALYDHLGDGTSLDYQNATNWSTIYGYGTITFAAIENSQYENYYADGTSIS